MASLTGTPGLTNMGTVTSEDSSLDSGLFNQPMPSSPSSQSLSFDLFGATRVITIKGKYTLGQTGHATVAAFCNALDALVNGAQTSVVYTSDKTGVSYTGLIQRVNWSADSGGVNYVDYIIEFIEGTI